MKVLLGSLKSINIVKTSRNFVDSSIKVATYGHIPVPLVYTQVVTVAIYFYFAVALVGEQWLIRRQRCLGHGWMCTNLLLCYL